MTLTPKKTMDLWTQRTHTHLAAGQGGLYHPVSICVLYIHHPSIQKIDPSESDMLILYRYIRKMNKNEIFESYIHYIHLSKYLIFPWRICSSAINNWASWASAPTPARGRELRRPGATEISMCFNVYSIILYIRKINIYIYIFHRF